MRHGGLPSTVINGVRTGTIRGRGQPKLRWTDSVTKWSARSVGELRRATIERVDQVMAATPGVRPHYDLRMGGRMMMNWTHKLFHYYYCFMIQLGMTIWGLEYARTDGNLVGMG